jgi:hypothetical protein
MLTDSELLDRCADERIFDGLGDFDIDVWVIERVVEGTEEEWKFLWRLGLREALRSMVSPAQTVQL